MAAADYLRILQQPPVQHPPAKRRVVFVSGLSDPSSCALTESQRRFLRDAPIEEEAKIYANFPFWRSDEARSLPPLWLAGWRNYRQYRLARGAEYRAAAEPHWRALRDATESLIIVTLSCGLELVNEAARVDNQEEIRIVALGPVARRCPTNCRVAQGSRDWISRRWFPRPDVTFPGVGHMDYLASRSVIEWLYEQICNNTSKSPAPDSICRERS